MLSETARFAVETVTVVPLTIKFPSTVKSPENSPSPVANKFVIVVVAESTSRSFANCDNSRALLIDTSSLVCIYEFCAPLLINTNLINNPSILRVVVL